MCHQGSGQCKIYFRGRTGFYLAGEIKTLHSLLAGRAREKEPYTASWRPAREKKTLHSLLAGRGGRLVTISLGI